MDLWRRQRLWRHVWRTELWRLHTAAQYVRLDSRRRRHVALLCIRPVNSNSTVNGHLHRSKIQSLLLLLTNYINTTKSFTCIDVWTCDLVVLKSLINTNLILANMPKHAEIFCILPARCSASAVLTMTWCHCLSVCLSVCHKSEFRRND